MASVEFRSATANATVAVELAPLQGGTVEVWTVASAPVTDLFATLAAPDSGHWEISWNDQAIVPFVACDFANDGKLTLALVAKLPVPVSADMSPAAFAAALRQRQGLTGRCLLCTLTPSTEAVPAREASAIPPAPQDLEISAGDGGGYELGFPARMEGDYDQNGEVNAADLTPLGILFGIKKGQAPDWLFEPHRRVDGDGNGEINLADITPIGKHFQKKRGTYRIESSIGTQAGPGAEWEVLEDGIGAASTTRFGDPVQTLGAAPFQRVADAARPGWAWYRLTYIAQDGTESAPGAPVLSPDLVAPSWPGGDSGGTMTERSSEDHELTWLPASDDRGGAVEYRILMRAGSGQPGAELPVAANFRYPETCLHPLASPFDFTACSRTGNPTESSIFEFRNATYHISIAALDSAGNSASDALEPFTPQFFTGVNPLPIKWGDYESHDPPYMELWISRTRDVRVVPPQISGENAQDIAYYYYTAIEPEGSRKNYLNIEDFDQGTQTAFDGREFTLEQPLSRNQRLYICLQHTDSITGKHGEVISSIGYPDYWLQPFEPANNFSALADIFRYLEDGTPYFGNFSYLKGPTLCHDDVEAYAGPSSNERFGRIPHTNDLLISGDTLDGETWVAWWRQGSGGQGIVRIPKSVLPGRNGFDSDAVERWLPVGSDSAIGVRSKPQLQTDSTYAVELWEANRDGSYRMRELLTPPGITSQSYCNSVQINNGCLVIEVVVKESIFSSHNEYFIQLEDGGWATATPAAFPSSFNSAAWPGAFIDELHYGEPESYVILSTWGDISKPEGERIRYTGMYKGDLREGLASFRKLWEKRSDQTFDPAHPGISGFVRRTADRYFNSACPGKLILGVSFPEPPYPGWEMTVNPDTGKIDHLFSEEELRSQVNFNWSLPYLQNSRYKPGIGRGFISADGNWMGIKPSIGADRGLWGNIVPLP